MKYFVNKHCIGCGLCTVVCPSVFSITEQNFAEAISGEVSEEHIKKAQHALDNCPANAIEEMA